MAKSSYKEKEKPAGPRARNDAYVVMLLITLIAIGTGSLLMYLDNEEYGKTAPPKEPSAPTFKLGDSGTGAAPAGAAEPKN
jgi:hypothetical protein